MALALKVLIQQDISGGSIWLTDKTGEYASPDNEGGWGAAGTPNPDLGDSALVFSVVRNTQAGKEKVSPVSSGVYFNDAALNTDEITFEFRYLMDGWHSISFFRLPVSADGVNTEEGGVLSDLDYYYDNAPGNNEVRQLDAGETLGYKVIDDYEEMIDNVDIVQITCEEMFYNKLAIKKNDLYKSYRDTRDKKGGQYKETRNYLEYVLDIHEDIRGADYAFRSGLMTEAQDIIETAVTRYKIT